MVGGITFLIIRPLIFYIWLCQQVIASRYSAKVTWLKQLLGHMDSGTRESVARLLGIASSVLPMSESSALISELVFTICGRLKFR